MDTLVMMSAPSQNGKREYAIEVLRAIDAARPGITWGELAAAVDVSGVGGLGCPGGLNGWFTDTLNTIGAIADPFTFGAASKVLIGARDVGYSVFASDKISDSLKKAGQGIADDAFSRFLDALPFGIGADLKTGYVVNRYWMIAALVAVGLFVFLWIKPKRRR